MLADPARRPPGSDLRVAPSEARLAHLSDECGHVVAAPAADVHSPPPRALPDALERALVGALDGERIDHVILRGSARTAVANASDILTLLVAPADIPCASEALRSIGFVRTPETEEVGRRRYCRYDEKTGAWTRIGVATDAWYGRGWRQRRMERGDRLLQRRQGSHLSAADELVELLLHCLLERGEFEPGHQARLWLLRQRLMAADGDGRDAAAEVERWLAPVMSWPTITAAIDTGRWEQLLARRRAVGRRLFRRAPAVHLWRWSLAAVCPALAPWRALRMRRGLVVALLGPDGAGKTTLAEALAGEEPLRARRIYMGTNRQAGDALAIGHWVARQRAVLAGRERGVARIARRALGALGAAVNLAEQRYRHALAARHRARGGIVVFDRYSLDATVNERLGRTPPASLARRLRRWLLRAGTLRPDVVLVLDAPGEVLYARKGEHSPDRLEQMRRAYAALERDRPDVVVVDAARDALAVGRSVTSMLWARRSEPRGAPASP